MLTKQDIEFTKLNELQILKGRRCDSGDFHFEKRTLASIDPFTQEKTWTAANEYCQPVIQGPLKGEEREVVAGEGILQRGDIIATIDWRKEINTTEPTEEDETQYLKAVYKNETYLIKQVHPDGLGSKMSRQIIYLAKETS